MFTGDNRLKAVEHMPTAGANEPARLIVAQLEQLLLEENASLENHGQANHSYFIEKKNHILRELIVLQRAASSGGEPLGNIEELKALIARNLEVLETNIKAIKEVTEALKSAALAEEADGTYSMDERRRGLAS